MFFFRKISAAVLGLLMAFMAPSVLYAETRPDSLLHPAVPPDAALPETPDLLSVALPPSITAVPREGNALPALTGPLFPKAPLLELNLSDETQLAALSGLDDTRARLIIAHRMAVSGFQRVEQLRDIFGISEERYKRIAPLFRVNTPFSSDYLRAMPLFPNVSTLPSALPETGN